MTTQAQDSLTLRDTVAAAHAAARARAESEFEARGDELTYQMAQEIARLRALLSTWRRRHQSLARLLQFNGIEVPQKGRRR